MDSMGGPAPVDARAVVGEILERAAQGCRGGVVGVHALHRAFVVVPAQNFVNEVLSLIVRVARVDDHITVLEQRPDLLEPVRLGRGFAAALTVGLLSPVREIERQRVQRPALVGGGRSPPAP